MTSPGNLLNNWPACKKILRRMPIGEPGRGMELGDGDEACHPAVPFQSLASLRNRWSWSPLASPSGASQIVNDRRTRSNSGGSIRAASSSISWPSAETGEIIRRRTPEPGWRPGQFLYYLDTIYTLLESSQFAARLALSVAGAPVMVVQIDLKGLQGRRLTTSDSSIALRGDY